MTRCDDPFASPLPTEVPLARAPLVRVIGQVRFPTTVSLEQRDVIAPFQNAIRADYPVLHAEEIQGINFTASGPSPIAPHVAWRFTDLASDWRASLTSDFLALESTAYTSRSDFLDRFHRLLIAVQACAEPALVERIGVRYIDRITGPELADINELVHADMRGIVGTPIRNYLQHYISDAMFVLGENVKLRARWGRLPASVTVDPTAIEPTDDPSWILDIDVSSTPTVQGFNPDQIRDSSRALAEKAYAFFRWAVADSFLERYK